MAPRVRGPDASFGFGPGDEGFGTGPRGTCGADPEAPSAAARTTGSAPGRSPSGRHGDRHPTSGRTHVRPRPTMTPVTGGIMAVDLSRRGYRVQRWAARGALTAA